MELAKTSSWRQHGRELSTLWMVTCYLGRCCANLMTSVLVLTLPQNGYDFLTIELEMTLPCPPFHIAEVAILVPSCHDLTLLNTVSQTASSNFPEAASLAGCSSPFIFY